ncbi:MAG: cation:proton antiporter [Trueperaceae bacterium]|nr:MAG: cation:proton antiporter [Trueperaceae bacterium]
MSALEFFRDTLMLVGSFVLVAVAAREVGRLFALVSLPRITGFLFTGIVAGPFVLGLIPESAAHDLRSLEEVALAFIAFAAGSELHLSDLKNRLKSIVWVTAGLIIFTFTLGSLAFLALADFMPFMTEMPTAARVGIAILAGTILVARSPSAAIAIINELRAKGPFVQTVLGVTVVLDFMVIVLFAVNSSVANTFLAAAGFKLTTVAILLLELLLSLVAGYLVAAMLMFCMSLHARSVIKSLLILAVGFVTFQTAFFIRDFTHEQFPFEVHLEPLLISLIASLIVTNFSRYRSEFSNLLHHTSLPVYVVFFTLTGASLNLAILATTWPIALALFGVRLLGIFLGSFTGGVLAGEPMRHNRIRWMGFVTQAGIALGLAREVAVQYPSFGTDFATIIIALVVLNETVGPIFFKTAIDHVGEAHARATTPAFDGVRDAIVFGLEAQSVVLARDLMGHDWQVKIAAVGETTKQFTPEDIEVHHVRDTDVEALEQLDANRADAIVCLLPTDEASFRICELVYEHYGIETVVVRLNDPANAPRFQELGAFVVDPSTATVSLVQEFVRSASTTSMLLGTAGNQEIVEIEIRDPRLQGTLVRELTLPLDTLILSVRRHDQILVSHGYTRLAVGDRVTVMGSTESLDEVMLLFSDGSR